MTMQINLKTAKDLAALRCRPTLLATRRRSDRMNDGMSAIGTKRTYQVALHMSAFGGKADMTRLRCTCPLLTQSGHGIRIVSA